MPEPPARRLLIVGWDAADWKLIDPLLASGEMPHLKRLIDRGARADLASLDPKLSPILWTSIATGKTADKHGILNFVEADPAGSVRVSSSASRKTKAIWNILSQSDRRSLIVNWYASHPAEGVGGVCVSNLFQEGVPDQPDQPWKMAPDSVAPPEAAPLVRPSRVHPASITREMLGEISPRLTDAARGDRRLPLLRRLLASCRSVHEATLALMRGEPSWDGAMVFYDLIDVAGHHFMQYHPPRMPHVSRRDSETFAGVMTGVYRLHDRMLGELFAAAGDDTTVILLSDHGFHSDHLRPMTPTEPHDEHAAMDATWHRQTGVLVMGGPGVRRGAVIRTPGLLDIAPTALALLGLPIGQDMDGRVLAEAIDGTGEFERVPSWDPIPGRSGMHEAGARVEPFEARQVLRQLADLGYIQPLGDDIEKSLQTIERESRFNLAVVYLSTGRSHEAVPHLRSLHEEFPDDVRFAMNLAHCLQACGDAPGAEATLGEFLRRRPGSANGSREMPEVRLLQAAILSAQGRHAEADALIEHAARQTPNDPEIWLALAETRRLGGGLDGADRAIAEALALDPAHPEALLCRARIALSRRDFEASAGFALDALERRHAMPHAHYTLGVALAWLGECDDAARSFEIALAQQPGMLDAHRFLAELARARGDLDAAERHGREAGRLLEIAGATPGFGRVPDDPFGPVAWSAHRGSSV